MESINNGDCARRQFNDELFGVINDTSKRQMEFEEYLLLTFLERGTVDLDCLSFGERVKLHDLGEEGVIFAPVTGEFCMQRGYFKELCARYVKTGISMALVERFLKQPMTGLYGDDNER
jgi:hypothetical protein|nr:MAG TPA: hypothetical protein [Caudoviricetes sp.]